MAGTCGAAIAATYAVVDRKGGWPLARLLFSPLQYMGMNAILVFFFHGTATMLLDIVFVSTPLPGNKGGVRHNLTGWIFDSVLSFVTDHAARQLLYTLLKIACFMVATWVCYRRGYFWKI